MATTVRFSTPSPAADSGLPTASFSAGLPPLSPISPSRRSRLQEKEELRQLNDRLATYIQRVRALEAAKAALQLRLGEYEEGSRRQEGGLRHRYEDELAEARRALDEQAIGRASLQVELVHLRQEHQQLLARNSKKENELSQAVSHARDLTAQLNAKEADLATSLSRQRSLEKSLQESQDQTSSLKETVNDAKSHLQSEILRRVDLENQVKTLQEQVTFLKNLHEDELKSRKRFYERKIQEIASGHQQEFESKLLGALQALRTEQDQQIRAYKAQMEQRFSDRIENAQLSAARNEDFANSARAELAKGKRRVDTLTTQNASLEARIRELEARGRELQRSLDCNREALERRVAEKDREMAEMRQQMQARLEEYERLLDVKLALDLEINAYRAMLEGEEQRLKLFRPSSEGVATSQGCRRLLQGKKRKRTVVKKQAHSVVLQRASSLGSVSVEDIDTAGKFVKIKNNSDKDQFLSGWTLRRQHRNESDIMFRFPDPFTLQASRVITIWGAREGSMAGSTDLVWQSQKSWGAGENVAISLFNASGKEMAEGNIAYVERGEGRGEVEEEAEEEGTELHARQNESRSCPIM